MQNRKSDFSLHVTMVVLCVTAVGMIAYKMLFLGYSFMSIIPQLKYEVDISMSFDGYGDSVKVSTYLPVSDERQTISDEINNSGLMSLEISSENSGRISRWYGENITGPQQILYSFSVHSDRILYELDDDLQIPGIYPEDFKEYLVATDGIQVEHPVIEKVYNENVPRTKNTAKVLKGIFDYAYSLKSMPFKGYTDAVTAASLGEGSCNGKSRVFVALARKAKIPSRLVGGLILKNTTKRISHQWVEAYVNGYWIPFDPLNNHYMEIPENYLVLYRGDEALFKHSANINFDYFFKIRERLATRTDFITQLGEHPLNIYNVWATFNQIGIPVSLLKIIIMLPLGAFIVVIFRNVIGLETFGTFLPALIAAASRETGFFWGIVGFYIVIGVVSLLRYPLDKWGVLHTPKMSILLIFVVGVMLSLTVAGVEMKLFELSHISLFPIAVLTLTAERFAILQIEEGTARSLKVVMMTTLVVWFCYMAMNSLAMEALFLAFPELLLLLIILNLWLGRWIGIRVMELNRFRWLIQK
ncbi:MAG: UUP1 family membrane protein [Nitrospinota bacterium]|nr:UUP1 family membrane protein [Nitrospinota bacterium]